MRDLMSQKKFKSLSNVHKCNVHTCQSSRGSMRGRRCHGLPSWSARCRSASRSGAAASGSSSFETHEYSGERLSGNLRIEMYTILQQKIVHINLNTEPVDVLDTRQCSCILLPQYRASLRPLTQFSGSLSCPWKNVEVSVIYRVSLTAPACETTQERNHPYRLGLRYLSQITFISVEVYTSQELYITDIDE